MVARLQVKASQIGKLLQDEIGRKTAIQLSKQKSESGPPVKKAHYIDPIPPFNANKIRKSPSASLTSGEIVSSSSSSSSKAATTMNTTGPTSIAQEDATITDSAK